MSDLPRSYIFTHALFIVYFTLFSIPPICGPSDVMWGPPSLVVSHPTQVELVLYWFEDSRVMTQESTFIRMGLLVRSDM